MKKNYVFVLLGGAVLGGLAFTKMSPEGKIMRYAAEKSHINVGGAPAGKAGAPGESSCAECHTGALQNGNGVDNLVLIDQATQQVVTEYTPGSTYTVTVTMGSTGSRRGFEATARIVNGNTQAGTMTGVSGSTTIRTGSAGKKYATQITSSSTSQTGWTFTWGAPVSNVGQIKFYMATNESNNNGNDGSGDVIRTSQYSLSPVNNAGIEETKKSPFSVAFNGSKQAIELSLNANEEAVYSLNLVDMSGKSVFFKRLGKFSGDTKETIYLPESVQAGVYIVHFFEDNNSYTQKIYISK